MSHQTAVSNTALRPLVLVREPGARCYPLAPLRAAELVTGQDRYALELIGGMCSRTTAEHVTVTRASDGVCVSWPQLMSSGRRRKDGTWRWRYTCKGVGGWATRSEALAGILAHVAARAEGQAAA